MKLIPGKLYAYTRRINRTTYSRLTHPLTAAPQQDLTFGTRFVFLGYKDGGTQDNYWRKILTSDGAVVFVGYDEDSAYSEVLEP